ncbi:hypothetical protein ACGFWE_08130 [Streptomyces sp. NPDC048523]|uniref:hypothetical protein n=1 Tax=Streptomyces sp. NPDC048523 TaxID=3365567 RepID=UPI0037222E69
MSVTVWILNPSYRDGPYQLLRMGWIARIEQDEDRWVVLHDTRGDKHYPVRMSKDIEVPSDFGVQLLQALDRARRAAQDANSDRVVAARHSADSWSWEVYAPDEVPPAQDEPPEPSPPSSWQPPPPFQAPVPGPNGSFVPIPKGGMPLWDPKFQEQKDQEPAEADAVAE